MLFVCWWWLLGNENENLGQMKMTDSRQTHICAIVHRNINDFKKLNSNYCHVGMNKLLSGLKLNPVQFELESDYLGFVYPYWE